MTERFPNFAPGLFKHISDIGDMERRFGGLAWRLYDESFRREKKAHHLDFGQIHWDLRFRCLEQSTQAGRPPFRSPNTRSPIVGNVPSRTGRYTGGQCFSFGDPALAANQPVLTSIPVPDARGPTRPATVAVNPPLPKVIVPPSRHTLPTPIKRDVLASYLLHYDEHESTILITGFYLGFSLHYDGPAYSRTSGNHRSALQAAFIVDRKLLHEVSLGRITGPFTHPPFNDFQSSPLGLVPKHDPGKFRLIHDLSFPRGDSINFYTSKQFTCVQYETLDQVVSLVQECGQGCFIPKADIKDAFRLIPIKPQDYHLLGMTWHGLFYHDKVLPMGSAISCQTFERFSRAVQWILQHHFAVDSVTHLLDECSSISMPQLPAFIRAAFTAARYPSQPG
ncbi:hypothetical protein NP493_919g01022 [Ridgeia piscesae]|uniref:Reverse transcriptase domain-containing protein n=1 Tax=Ridgeia piscesae TaxID=27915 RepID=A0AAD9KJU4_RIDPI|nr:hypothetical protein NP493_919g01022 [Ridgeia piscesae]